MKAKYISIQRIKVIKIQNNNGSVVIKKVTAVFGSTTDEGGGALRVIGTPQVVNNTRFIDNNNTSTGGVVYVEGENVTINENECINNNGSYQVIDQDFEEVLGNVTGRNTTLYNHVGWNNITQIVGNEEGGIIRELVGGEAFAGNRTVHLQIIDRINPGETAVILFNQTVTARDANNKINNTMYVIVPDSRGDIFQRFEFNQTIWTSDPVTITFDDSFTVTNKTIHRGSPIGSLPVPEKEGYILDGWYTESGVKVSPKTVINASMKLYARWVEKEKPAVVSVPQTGDQWNVWLYAGIGIVAVIGLVVLILRRRK
ncbi:MAG: InlB B-repeat-containing protein [Clostridia bacterium]|nr:InlB B-repeat-containing protein [Clostridia bacterium]